MQRDELERLLFRYHIPIVRWGREGAKTLDHLLAELGAREFSLVEQGGILLRTLSTAIINVYHDSEEGLWLLREDRQEFKDGRMRRRVLSTSLGEKILHNEQPLAAACRALEEELGIKECLELRTIRSYKIGPKGSPSYPGLQSLYSMHEFEVFLPTSLYRPEGYVERQSDKTNITSGDASVTDAKARASRGPLIVLE